MLIGRNPKGFAELPAALPRVIRLYGYAIHRGIPMSAMDSFAGRIETVDALPCSSGIVIPLR